MDKYSEKSELIQPKRILILFSILMFFIYTILIFSTNYIPISPDENIFIFFSNLLSKTGNLSKSDNLNSFYETIIFAPRGSVYSRDTNSIVPMNFLGIFLINSLFNIFTDFIYLINPLFGVFGLLVFYLFSKEFFNEKISTIITILVGILPMYVYYSSNLNSDLPSIILLFFGFYYFIKYSKNGNLKIMIISTLFFSLSIWYRLINLIYVFFFVAIFTLKKNINGSYFKVISILGLFLIIFLVPIIFFNNQLYGSYFKTGYHIMRNYVENTESELVLPKFSGSFLSIINNFLKYYLILEPIISILGFLSLIILFRENKKHLIIFFLISLLFSLFYFGSGLFYGSMEREPALGHSFVRYYLLFYILLTSSFSFYLITNVKKKELKVFLIFLIVLLHFLVIFGNDGIFDLIYQMEKYEKIKNTLLSEIHPDCIVFSRFYDKLIFPERQVANYMILNEDERLDEILRIITSLKRDKMKVCFLEEEDYFGKTPFIDIKKKLESSGFILEKIPDSRIVYEVKKEEVI